MFKRIIAGVVVYGVALAAALAIVTLTAGYSLEMKLGLAWLGVVLLGVVVADPNVDKRARLENWRNGFSGVRSLPAR